MSHDTLIHRIVRPAVRRIAPTGVTPNQLTTVRLLTGLGAAAAFAQGGAAWGAVGGAVFLVSMLFDRADGELARQTGRMSAAGHRYDLATDCVADAAAFVGIGLGLSRTGYGEPAIAFGIVAGIGIAVLFWQINVLKLIDLPRYSVRYRRVVADPDDALALLPVLVWVGLAWPTLIVAAIVTPLGALAIAFAALRARRAVAAPGQSK
jgi:archaetidylinositol phosphate synthase